MRIMELFISAQISETQAQMFTTEMFKDDTPQMMMLPNPDGPYLHYNLSKAILLFQDYSN